MIRYLLTILLLITFNANVIAGASMKIAMSPTHDAVGMSVINAEHQSTMSTLCPSQVVDNGSCETDHHCELCLAHCSAAMPVVTADIVHPPQMVHQTMYRYVVHPTVLSTLLRPPKRA